MSSDNLPLDDLAARSEALLQRYAYNARTTRRGHARFLTRVAGRVVGADPAILAEVGYKQRRSTVVLAMSVMVTVSLASIYGYLASGLYVYGAVRFTRLTVVAAVLLALFVYAVERVLLEMLSRDFKFARNDAELAQFGPADRSNPISTFFKLLVAFSTRFVIAMLIATVVSEPILLLIYEDDVDNILQARRDVEYADRVADIEAQYDAEIEAEGLRSNIDVSDLNNQKASLRANRETLVERQEDLPALIVDAGELARLRRSLADCEEGGVAEDDPSDSLSASCTADVAALNALQGTAIRLSGAPTCDRLCRGHEAEARAAEAQVQSLESELDGLPSSIEEIDEATAVLDEDIKLRLSTALQVELVEESGFYAASPLSARSECDTTYEALVYRQIVSDQGRVDALFTYCGVSPPGDDVFVPYTGLQARQDAFEVAAECSDPNGLRYTEVDPDEPRLCAVASGVGDPATLGRLAPESEDGFWARLTGTLSQTFNVPDSSLGRSAARLRFLILLLDTMPILLKFSQSLRRYREYDALESFQQQTMHAALAFGLSDVRGDTPSTRRKRRDRLNELLSVSGRQLRDLLARPSERHRLRRGPSGDRADDEAVLAPTPNGAVDLASDPLLGAFRPDPETAVDDEPETEDSEPDEIDLSDDELQDLVEQDGVLGRDR